MNRTYVTLIAFAAIAFYGVLSFLYRPFVADDAYIVGRYAENVIRGHGLVYNVGEYVTALTSPLHALVLTGIAAVFENPVSLYRILGSLLPVLGWGLAVLIYRPTGREVAVVSLLGLASPFLALWSGGGLETPILSALLTLFAAVLFRVARRDAATSVDILTVGALSGLAFLTRFDSIIITLPPMLAVALVMWRRPALWVGAVISGLIAGGWLVFSYLYYGDILPTSAYIKLSAHATQPMDNVAVLVNALLVSGAAVWALVAVIARQPGEGALSRIIGRGAAISAMAFAYYAYTSAGVHMMFSFRFFMPVLIVAAMLIAAGVRHLGRPLWVLLAAQAALQITVGSFVHTTGMNIFAVNSFGSLGKIWPEYRRTTPREYGAFMAILEQDAVDLKAHWDQQGQDKTPYIYLYTGGMGYWLPDFYVFETLASYRHNCGYNLDRVLATTHYVQDLSIGANELVRKVYNEVYADQPAEELSKSDFTMDEPWSIVYKFNTPDQQVTLPSLIGGPC